MPVDLRRLRAGDTAGASLVVIPAGSIEQHCGLPAGLDCLVAERLSWLICEWLEERRGIKCVIAPPICYGYSPEWATAAGTISLSLETFSQLLEDVVRGLARWGFRRIIVLNAHYGNSDLISAKLRMLADMVDATLAAIDYWRVADIELGHASEVEKNILSDLGYDIDDTEECEEAAVYSHRGVKVYTRGKGGLERISADGYPGIMAIIQSLANAIAGILEVDEGKHYVG